MKINSKPSFFDAVHLSSQSPLTNVDTPYQSIPFNKRAIIPIHSFNSEIHITCEQHSIQIYNEKNDLTEKEVFEFLTHFAVKEGNKVSFLAVFPNNKDRLKNVKSTRVLAESKKIKEKSDV
ncbi:hypothetical protein [Neobacillus drentensis]|uniref:hypothetical protein n=1 Tax=Neobacillus drentensis TaxID=220684 RepID=UPI00300139FC